MTRYKTQEMFDGIAIQHHRARYAGTVDLTDNDLAELHLDGLTVMVVAVRVTDAGVKVLADSGEARLNYVLGVQYAAPLTGEMREQALSYLRDQAGEIHFPVTSTHTDTEAQPAAVGYADPPSVSESHVEALTETGADPATGEIPVEGSFTGDPDPESRVIERNGPPPDDTPPAPTAFRTAAFDPTDPDVPAPASTPDVTPPPAVEDAVVVGRVHRADRRGDGPGRTEFEEFMAQ